MKTKEEILDSHIAAMISKYPDEYESLTKMKASPEYQTTLEAMEEHSAQFNKPPVYGQTAEELTGDEINALRSVGIIAENWYAVSYNSNSMPYAIFQNEDYAKAYRDRFSATSIVDPWPMKIKDYRKKALPPSPGSVDVEEKKECQHEALTDTGVGYHHCPTCNASFKVDGLGDSSGLEKDESKALKNIQ